MSGAPHASVCAQTRWSTNHQVLCFKLKVHLGGRQHAPAGKEQAQHRNVSLLGRLLASRGRAASQIPSMSCASCYWRVRELRDVLSSRLRCERGPRSLRGSSCWDARTRARRALHKRNRRHMGGTLCSVQGVIAARSEHGRLRAQRALKQPVLRRSVANSKFTQSPLVHSGTRSATTSSAGLAGTAPLAAAQLADSHAPTGRESVHVAAGPPSAPLTELQISTCFVAQ